MKDFLDSFGFIIAFLIGIILMQMTLGTKVTNRYIVLVFIGALFYNQNYKKITNLLNEVNK